MAESAHKVVMFVYPNAQILDISGPLEIFGRTARILRDRGITEDLAYTVEITGKEKGPFATSSGIKMLVERSYDEIDDIDTFMVTGGIGYKDVLKDEEVLTWIYNKGQEAERVASVCTGSMILAKANLLNGARVTTHWAYFDQLSDMTKDTVIDDKAIFTRNGKIYTSAGVTAGIDMALAMVEDDYGHEVALSVAQELVLYLKRPGGQSQFSRALGAQRGSNAKLSKTIDWIVEHVADDFSVNDLAEIAGMSPRSFARHFKKEMRDSPANYVEKIRVEQARRLLEAGYSDMTEIAVSTGFKTADNFRRSVKRVLGVSPKQYLESFG